MTFEVYFCDKLSKLSYFVTTEATNYTCMCKYASKVLVYNSLKGCMSLS